MAGDLAQLDAGQGGIDWNSLISQGINTAGQVAVLKQQQANQTPVPYVSPVQVATPSTGIPIIWLVAGAAALFLLMKFTK
jgi:hypothetical protein